jgi:hypothetical protein
MSRLTDTCVQLPEWAVDLLLRQAEEFVQRCRDLSDEVSPLFQCELTRVCGCIAAGINTSPRQLWDFLHPNCTDAFANFPNAVVLRADRLVNSYPIVIVRATRRIRVTWDAPVPCSLEVTLGKARTPTSVAGPHQTISVLPHEALELTNGAVVIIRRPFLSEHLLYCSTAGFRVVPPQPAQTSAHDRSKLLIMPVRQLS